MNRYIFEIIIVVVVLVLVVLIFRQRNLIRSMRQLANEAEQQRQQAMAAQQRNQQLKQEMTSNIAHELKTPVSSIRGYLEILLGDHPVDEEKRRFFLDRCYRQTLRLSDLIHDVSIINKVEESSDLFPKEVCDVSAIMDDAVTDLQAAIQAHSICVKNKLSHPLVLEGNKSLLYAIFRNLTENAVAYAGEGVEVCVECYKNDEDRYYLHFYDTGMGVNNSYLDKLFDRFLRIDEGRSRKNGGTGLGLSIVKHAVQFHGGDIYAKNRDEGGLEFFFSLKKNRK